MAKYMINKNCNKKYRKLKKQFYQLKHKNQRLEDFINHTRPTGICELCTEKSVKMNDYAHRVLKQIKTLIKQGVKLHDDVIINRVELDFLIKRYESDNGIIL